MKKITLSQVIKNIIKDNEDTNPFSDNFDSDLFFESIKKESEILKEDFEIVQEGGKYNTINIIFLFNEIYEKLMLDIETLIEEVNLKTDKLVEKILSLSNFTVFKAMTETSENQLKGNSRIQDYLPRDVNDSNAFTVENIFGEEINVNDLIDKNVDVVDELLKIIYSFDIGHSKSLPILKVDIVNKKTQELTIITNLLVNLKDYFGSFLYEFSHFEYEDDKINIKTIPDYYLKKIVGKDRNNSLILESTFYALEIFQLNKFKKYFAPNISISNQTLNVLGKELILNEYEYAPSFSTLIVFYSHLHPYRIKKLGNITPSDILDFLVHLKFTFRKLDTKAILEDISRTKTLNSIPIKIKQEVLIKYLKKTSKLKEVVIRKLLNALTQTPKFFNSLWDKPLLLVGKFYHFALPSIAFFNECYLLDVLFQEFIPQPIQNKLFKKSVIDDLSIQSDNDFYLNVVNLDKFKNIELDDFILIDLKNSIICIQVVLIDFPIDYNGYKNALSKLGLASFDLNEKVSSLESQLDKVIEKHEKKELIKIVLTNHTALSGININGNQILDIKLFNNYFKTGEYKRGLIISGEEKVNTNEFASIKYYNTEDEFNNNFSKFIYYPEPITEKLKNYRIKEYPVGLPKMKPQIFAEGIEQIPLSSIIWTQVNEFGQYLQQLYYFESEYDNDENSFLKTEIEKRIKFVIPQIFDLVAFYKKDRKLRFELLRIFKDVDAVGTMHLIFAFQNLLSSITSKKIKLKKEKEENSNFEIDHEKAKAQLDIIFEKTIKTNGNFQNVRPSSFTLNHELNSEDFKNLVRYIEYFFGVLEMRYYTEEEFDNFLFFITIYLGLVGGKEEYQKTIKKVLGGFVDILNFNNFYQKARDFCEEILEYSLQRENNPSTGWACLFKCFTQQKNAVDASFYGCLTLATVNRFNNHDKETLIDVLYNAMIYFRNFGIKDMVKKVYDALMTFDLDDYDKQRFTLSYYNSFLLQPQNDWKEFLKEVEDFIKTSAKKIILFEKNGILPWLTFLYNLRIIEKKGFISNFQPFEKLIRKFEKEIDVETLKSIQAKFFPIERETKKIFQSTLKKIFETRNYEDLASELNELKLATSNVISLSLMPVDIDNLLLSNLIICDNSLSFYEKAGVEVAPFFKEKDILLNEKLENYSDFIFQNLKLEDGQVLVWIFDNEDKIYSLIINHKNEYELIEIPEWDLITMKNWLSKISDFYFDDKGDYPINLQEQDYIDILEKVNFAQLKLNMDFDEIFLFASLNLAIFPHNLISIETNNGLDTLDDHEEQVKESITKESNLDFISFHKPITNVVSLEWFIQKSKIIEIPKSDFGIEAWIPIDDEDFAISKSYDKLKDIIETNYNGIIHTSPQPETKLKSTINIFLAHGGKGFEGFRTLYTKEGEEGKAIMKGEGVSRLFGDGTIAILFVCDSASISKEIYSERLNSFTYQILSLGYQAVIAPAWSLSTDIPSAWLGSFIESLLNGEKLSMAVFNSNKKVSKKGYNQYHGFYSPTGWAALHLYGNPNIRIV